MLLAQSLTPPTLLSRIGQQGVAIHIRKHFGELNAICERQEHREDFRTSDDRDRFAAS